MGPASDRHDSLRDLFFFVCVIVRFVCGGVCFVRFSVDMVGTSIAREEQKSGMKKRKTNIAKTEIDNKKL